MGLVTPLRRNRDYMLVWAGQAVSEIGSQVSTVAYRLLVLALTHSPAKAGVVGLAATSPLPLLALPAGMLADHVDRRVRWLWRQPLLRTCSAPPPTRPIAPCTCCWWCPPTATAAHRPWSA
jgi:hypothetical protein